MGIKLDKASKDRAQFKVHIGAREYSFPSLGAAIRTDLSAFEDLKSTKETTHHTPLLYK